MNNQSGPRQPFGPRVATAAKPGQTSQAKSSEKPLENGFTATESALLHEAITLSGMKWFDGDNVIMAKQEQFELSFRSGESPNTRWVVMAFPLYNMNDPNSAEICLHFLAEAHTMIHVLDFQYQVGINMESENLEFLMQLPLTGITGAQMAELIRVFFDALANSVMKELDEILGEMNQ
ncbi:hypothetical protein [Limnobacter parvus]|uniref:YbjN domain-containing protein n=1 Tax=Limnobacter parvus TaxID=2939690 RepID=A0ABT1XIE0_9BURK|nr:hypothetical protein [Limnobacter parvus]MCR2747053.1 hypothetical protein [Limnobacter parvus]